MIPQKSNVMQDQIEKIAKELLRNGAICIEGQFGSGKTYWARELPNHLVAHFGIKNIFALSCGYRFKENFIKKADSRNSEASVYEVFYTDDSGKTHNWQSFHEAIAAFTLLKDAVSKTACETITGWEELYNRLKIAEYTFVLILDDYDYELWHDKQSPEDFDRLRELQKLGVKFVLTSRKELKDISKTDAERRFLQKLNSISVSLPSKKEAKNIARVYYDKIAQEKEIMLVLADEHLEQIVEMSGYYPFLIVHLIKALIKNLPEKWQKGSFQQAESKEIYKLIRELRRDEDFVHCISYLWGSLTPQEQQVLAMITLAQIANRKFNDVYLVMRRRYPSQAPETKDFEAICNDLENRRFLLQKENDEYKTPSSAVVDYVLRQEVTKKLAKQTDIRIEKTAKFAWILSLLLWGVLGYGVYLFVILTLKEIYPDWHRPEWVEWVSLSISLLPASLCFIYYFIESLIRK